MDLALSIVAHFNDMRTLKCKIQPIVTFHTTVNLWNNLPDEFKSITNLDVFKVKIKQHFFKGIFEKLNFRYFTL